MEAKKNMDLTQDTYWGGNRLVLTKSFNLGIIDSDRQFCPWPMGLDSQAPYSYLQQGHAGFRLELHCFEQLNLTEGNRHDGNGLLSQKFLYIGSFSWQVFCLSPEVVTFHWRATHFAKASPLPAGAWSSMYLNSKPNGETNFLWKIENFLSCRNEWWWQCLQWKLWDAWSVLKQLSIRNDSQITKT